MLKMKEKCNPYFFVGHAEKWKAGAMSKFGATKIPPRLPILCKDEWSLKLSDPDCLHFRL